MPTPIEELTASEQAAGAAHTTGPAQGQPIQPELVPPPVVAPAPAPTPVPAPVIAVFTPPPPAPSPAKEGVLRHIVHELEDDFEAVKKKL